MDESKDNCAVLIEQYKIYIQAMEHVRDRRFRQNRFYSTLLLGLVGLLSLLIGIKSNLSPLFLKTIFVIIGCLGITICFVWIKHIDAYYIVNQRKFNVLYEMEKLLPYSPFKMEAEIGEREPLKIKWGIASNEKILPLTLMIIFSILATFSIFLTI